MEIRRCEKEAFTVIGKEGSTGDGDGFIQRLWEEANSHFGEVAHLAKKDEKGNVAGVWGAMSDETRSFLPWEDGFTKGLYLAGVECEAGAEAPEGWRKWVIPGFEYVYAERAGNDTFARMLEYLKENGLELVGAVQEFNCPETRKEYLFSRFAACDLAGCEFLHLFFQIMLHFDTYPDMIKKNKAYIL